MANSFTGNLNKRKPAAGDFNWDNEWHENEDLDDVTVTALLSKNRVISGCGVTDGGGLYADIADGIVDINGAAIDVTRISAQLSGGLATDDTGQSNWVYLDSSGAIQTSTTAPTGVFVPLAMVDCDETSILRIADLRPMARDAEVGVENLCINPNFTINQRSFGGDWSTLSVGAYGYDRWRKGVTASTIEQPVVNTSINGGSHVLTWDGGGTGDLQQSGASVVSGSSPLISTLADQTQAILVVPEGATNICFYAGDRVLPVRTRTKEHELDECLVFAWRQVGNITLLGAAHATNAYVSAQIKFPKKMRATPQMTVNGAWNYVANCGSGTVDKLTTEGFRMHVKSTVVVAYLEGGITGDATNYLFADAEIH